MIPLLIAAVCQAGSVELAAVGDVMLGRWVERRIEREGADLLFDAVRSELAGADLTFGNLECVLSLAPFVAKKRILLRASPSSASALAKAGFDVLSVANNHALDCGEPGLADTVRTLRATGVKPVGDNAEPVMFDVKGLKLAFLAFSEYEFGPRGLQGSDLLALIRRAQKLADVVIVSWHWGSEGSAVESSRQKELARKAAEAGADLILGHHPHVLQPIRWLERADGRRCLVAYSLGNFVFDAVKEPERKTAILHITLDKSGVKSFRTTPWCIRNGSPQRTQKRGKGLVRGKGLEPSRLVGTTTSR